MLRGLQGHRNAPERPLGSLAAPMRTAPVSTPMPASEVQSNVPRPVQPIAADAVGYGLGTGLRAVANGIMQVGTEAGPWTLATARRGWTFICMTPRRIDPLLKAAAGEGNDVIYRFFQVVAVVVSVTAVLGMLALTWLASWLWCSVPCLAMLLGIALLLVGGKTVERSRAAGGGIAGVGILMVFLGLPFTGLHISRSLARQHQENEIRQANEQVASLLKIAQESFEKGDLDKAENELQQISLVPKATDTHVADSLQEKIRSARQEAAVRKANREVGEYVRRADMDFSAGSLEAAEEKLAKALAVERATDTAKAHDLLAKIPARRQELVNEKVTKLVADATESFHAGQFDKALQTVNEALVVKNATNTGEAEQFLETMGDARPDLLARDAMQAIQQRRYSVAVKRLKAYLAHPRSEKKPVATQVLKLVEILMDGDKAQASLKAMSDSQIKSLSEDGKLPDDFATTNATLAEAVKTRLAGYVPQERNRRQAEAEEKKEAARAKEREALAKQNAEWEERRKREPAPKKWYEGGTLHRATIAEWRRASYENRLATCSDFVMTMRGNGIVPKDLPVDEYKPYAVDLEKGISIVANSGKADHENVAAVAATIRVLEEEKE